MSLTTGKLFRHLDPLKSFISILNEFFLLGFHAKASSQGLCEHFTAHTVLASQVPPAGLHPVVVSIAQLKGTPEGAADVFAVSIQLAQVLVASPHFLSIT